MGGGDVGIRGYRWALALAAVLLLALPGSALARTEQVTSFDGTKITVNFFPTDATGGKPAPTVLFGPGWGSPGDDNPDSLSDPTVGSVGIGPLRAAGYNVLTWDPRGFGDSEGTVQVDGPETEGRDVQALIDFVATQPEAKLDKPGDPRLGMTGASYGGGIQLVAAGLDPRIDAIVPDIAWHSLTTSLYKDSTFKTGWATLLYTLGKVAGRLDPHIDSAFLSGQATGRISADDEAWFRSRGPGDLVKKVKVPTLLVQGTVDTLFTLNEAMTNYRILHRNGVPVKMLWFCGGHGSCLTDPGDTTRIERATINWLNRWLARDKSVKTGPGFDWINQDGQGFKAKQFPPQRRPPVKASGSGSLPIQPLGGSGPSAPGPGAVGGIAALTNGSKAANAVNVTVDGGGKTRQLVGTPKLALSYSGTATSTDTRVYAQLVDDDTGLVLGNQVTPLPLTLDGEKHELSRRLEGVAHTLRPGSTVTLQLTASATDYGLQRAAGTVNFDGIDLTIPSVRAKPKKKHHKHHR
jgi:ABC-2 type transport system ATP-binding protein